MDAVIACLTYTQPQLHASVNAGQADLMARFEDLLRTQPIRAWGAPHSPVCLRLRCETCGCAVFHAWGCLQVAISGFAAWNLFAVRCAAPRRCHPSRCRRDCGGVRLCGPQSLRRDLSADFWRNAVGNTAERDYPVSLGARHICRAEPDARKQASKSVTLAAVLTEPLLAAIDGERTITEICREQSNRSLARFLPAALAVGPGRVRYFARAGTVR
jgi:hypothetical protein